MSVIKTRAIVLKTQDIKENDKLVWAYTEDLGKITLYVKGAKKSKSKLFTLTNSFSYSEEVVYKGKSFYHLNEGILIDSFNEVMDDLDSLLTASYFSELTDIATVEEEKNENIFKLLVASFYLLKTRSIDYDMLARAYELKLLNLTGYNLNLDKCTCCGRKLDVVNYFDVENHGGICNDCADVNSVKISPSAYNSLKFINGSSFDKLGRLKLSFESREEIKKLNTYIIMESYGKVPNSLKMLKKLKEE
jgi:DNA repair protein RecO (recombination protein O)